MDYNLTFLQLTWWRKKNHTWHGFSVILFWLLLVVFCSCCTACGLHYYDLGTTEAVLFCENKTNTSRNKSDTSDLVVRQELSQSQIVALYSSVYHAKSDKSPKTPTPVSAALASLNLVLCILNLHPCDSGAGRGDEWLKLSPLFFSSVFYMVATLSPLTDTGCTEFHLGRAGMVWIQTQPSVKRQTRQKIEHLHQNLQQSVCLNEIFMYGSLKLPLDAVLSKSRMWLKLGFNRVKIHRTQGSAGNLVSMVWTQWKKHQKQCRAI